MSVKRITPGVESAAITSVVSGIDVTTHHLFRFGRVVTLSLSASRSSGFAGETLVCHLPVGFRPASYMRLPAGSLSYQTAGHPSRYALIYEDGRVIVNCPSTVVMVAASFVAA